MLIAALFATILYLYFSTRFELKEMQEAMRAERVELEGQANEMLEENTESLLMLASKGFGWAVRAEFIRGNEEQVQQYITQLVKEEKITRVEFIDPAGKIKFSSDRKREGQNYDISHFDADPLHTDKPQYEFLDEQHALLFSPVMGLERRLGTLSISYIPDQFAYSPKDAVEEEI